MTVVVTPGTILSILVTCTAGMAAVLALELHCGWNKTYHSKLSAAARIARWASRMAVFLVVAAVALIVAQIILVVGMPAAISAYRGTPLPSALHDLRSALDEQRIHGKNWAAGVGVLLVLVAPIFS